MDCDEIEAEVYDLDDRVRRLTGQVSDKKGKNTAIFVGGLFLFPVWFFADLSDAEKLEMQAMQDRASHLQSIADKKNCGF